MSVSADRRRVLQGLGAALLGGTALAITSRSARAFQTLPYDDYSRLIDRSCGPNSQHEKLIDAILADRHLRRTDPEAQVILAQTRCPICGCPLMQQAPKAS
jgi:hypothetical protein